MAWPMRLFVGIPVPQSEVYRELAGQLEALGARPVPDGTWHMTLRFLGDMDDAQPVRDALAGALEGEQSLPAVVAGVGAFQSPRKARIVWAAVQAEGVEALAKKVEDATQELGQPPDRRDFVPHVTLARLKRPKDLRSFCGVHESTRFAQGVLDEVVLYRSVLTPAGPRYERAAVFPLEPADEEE